MLLSFSRRTLPGELASTGMAVSSRERDRVAAVARFDPCDPLVRAAATHAAQVAATLLDSAIGLCTLVDAQRVRIAGSAGLEGVVELPCDAGFCATTVAGGRTRQIERADEDARTAAHPLVTGPLKLRFYAAAPLVTSDGHAVGTLAAFDSQTRSVGPRELSALEALAALTMDILERSPAPRSTVLDDLTGLPGRRRFWERLEDLAAESPWERSWGAIATIEAAGLSQLEARTAGGCSAALRGIAEALRLHLDGSGDAYRIDANEFAIVAGVGATYDPARVATVVDDAIRTVRLAGYPELHARVGVVSFDEVAQPRAAFRLADWRMYAEKLERC
jgi:GGDEF domain-containing protein